MRQRKTAVWKRKNCLSIGTAGSPHKRCAADSSTPVQGRPKIVVALIAMGLAVAGRGKNENGSPGSGCRRVDDRGDPLEAEVRSERNLQVIPSTTRKVDLVPDFGPKTNVSPKAFNTDSRINRET